MAFQQKDTETVRTVTALVRFWEQTKQNKTRLVSVSLQVCSRKDRHREGDFVAFIFGFC
jgi:hypothetical protein